jgi:hypothetical protein
MQIQDPSQQTKTDTTHMVARAPAALLLLVASTTYAAAAAAGNPQQTKHPAAAVHCHLEQAAVLAAAAAAAASVPAAAAVECLGLVHPGRHGLPCMLHPFLVKVTCRWSVDAHVTLPPHCCLVQIGKFMWQYKSVLSTYKTDTSHMVATAPTTAPTAALLLLLVPSTPHILRTLPLPILLLLLVTPSKPSILLLPYIATLSRRQR